MVAHGDLHDQISALTARLEKQTDASTLVQRGELYRLHGEFDLALADAAAAEKLNSHLPAINLLQGRTYYELAQFHQAKTAFDVFLAVHPDSVEALVLRARASAKLKEFREAAADFTAAIAKSSAPQPDFFLERSHALVAAGDSEAALAGLNDGLQKLGPIVSLQVAAIKLEEDLKRFDSALLRVRQIASQSPRKEPWLVLAGEISERAGRREEARKAFADALSAIELLSVNRRGSESVQNLEIRARSGLDRLVKFSRFGAVQ